MFCRTLIALTLSALSACSTVPAEVLPGLDLPPANLLVLCPPPAQLDDRPYLTGEFADADAALAFQYHDCAQRQHRLVEWVREAVKAVAKGGK